MQTTEITGEHHLPDDLPLQTAKDHPIPADAIGVKPQGRCQDLASNAQFCWRTP